MAKRKNKNQNERCVPLEKIEYMKRKFPDWLTDVDLLVKNQGSSDACPAWGKRCYVPSALVSLTLALEKNGGVYDDDLEVEKEMIFDGISLAALSSWRRHKQVFSFAPEVEAELLAQGDDTELPVDVLYQLPYDCLYIETSTVPDVEGFFVCFDNANVRTPDVYSLQFIFCGISEHMDSGMISATLRLEKGKTISQCILVDDEAEKRDGALRKSLGNELAPFVQLVLYICAQNAEIRPDEKQERIYRKPAPDAEIKDKFREVQKFVCGEETAAAIRAYKKSSDVKYVSAGTGKTGSAKSPHSRRAHWHSYWTGPRDGERKLIVKWVAPTYIHKDLIQSDFTTNVVQTPLA